MDVDSFIERWKRSGGNERANTQPFITELCLLLGTDPPGPTSTNVAANDYVFERHVIKREIDGTESNGWIDCYKRDCFILEAKQGSDADIKAVDSGADGTRIDFFGQTAGERFKRGMARRNTGQWTSAMQRAAGQAEGYAKALPADHGWPPFLLVSDIGWCVDVYADFSRSGKGYAPFPDRRRFRITLDDLRDADVRARLKAIWDAPMSLDPSAEAARVTREVAGHLAVLAKRLEARDQNPNRVADFLMRLLFTMFAEDTGLIPKKSFSALLRKTRDRPELLSAQLSQLWKAMDEGGLAFGLGEAGETVRRFNGYLFKDQTAILLEEAEIDVLIAAAAADWRQVEPAIFGTLLERALDPKERGQLGAFYTPRAYVERLVGPTIMEPLRDDWLGARTAAAQAAEGGDQQKAREIIEAFHTKLSNTKVLDPACGTGNFLYVAMARMKELEGEVLELLEELGDERYLSELGSHTITPANFLGIEINLRAAAIAQLVLWIGYLQWHFRVNGEERMPEPPILRDVKTIECRDALIDWDSIELERDERGMPVTRWDGETMRMNPLTGDEVPDESAQVEVVRYINPRPAKWPAAEFIIGNPPFIGGNNVRDRLGAGYFAALFSTTNVPESADFVMHWWDRAAFALRTGLTRRFGFVTTNSITHVFSRRVIAKHLDAKDGISLIFAIPNHPWIDEKDGAAVRIAMTVARQGKMNGLLWVVCDESAAPEHLGYAEKVGLIGSDLRIGADVTAAKPLKANKKIASRGVQLMGNGFIITPKQAAALCPKADQTARIRTEAGDGDMVIFDYRNGRDLAAHARRAKVIDLYGLTEAEVRASHPAVYQHLLATVKPHRQQNNRLSYREKWWLFGEQRPELRKALNRLTRYIATVETTKHRSFQFLPNSVLADNMLVCIALDDSFYLGVLSSRFHVLWAVAAGGRMGVGDDPRYNKTRCFDPFPFPIDVREDLKDRIRRSAESLDALRKQVLEAHTDLTLTELYNLLESLRAGRTFSEDERDMHDRGLVSLIRQYHDEIDAAVAEAYGWPLDLSDEQILERLVALNKERAAEEAGGLVRWLRPEFQAPGYVKPAEQVGLALPEAERPSATILEWPKALPEQVVAVAAVVERSGRPIAANDVARAFRSKRANTVAPVLDALAGMGRLRKLRDGRYAA